MFRDPSFKLLTLAGASRHRGECGDSGWGTALPVGCAGYRLSISDAVQYSTSLLVKEIKLEVNTFGLLARLALCHRHQRAPASAVDSGPS